MKTVKFLDKLNQLDLQLVIDKLMSVEHGLAWTQEQTELAIKHYKLFLYLQFILPHVPLVPTIEIDEVWHAHILVDTYKYIQDCHHLYGYILHHRFVMKKGNIHESQNGLEVSSLFNSCWGDTLLTDLSLKAAPCVDLPIHPHSEISACMTLPTPNRKQVLSEQRGC